MSSRMQAISMISIRRTDRKEKSASGKNTSTTIYRPKYFSSLTLQTRGNSNLHGLRIRVYGEKDSLEWVQEQPNELVLRPVDGPYQTLSRGFSWLSPAAQRASRLWPGHPEGYLEAFTDLYSDIADAVLARRDGVAADPLALQFPTVEDGVQGVKFVDAAVVSHQ
jgi:predicted dehydrogenase